MRVQIGCRVSVEEADNPPTSSCHALLPAGAQQIPETTELRRNRQKKTRMKSMNIPILTYLPK